MVVVILMAGGALLALRSYNSMAAGSPEVLEKVLFSIKQQAGIMAALSAAVFAVISALQRGAGPVAAAVSNITSAVPSFGRPTGLLSGAVA